MQIILKTLKTHL